MIHIIHELRKTRSRNKKIEVLKKYEDYPGWKKYLFYVYDPHSNYYINSVADSTFYSIDEYDSVNIIDMFDALDILSSRTFTGNLAKDFAINCSRDFGELFRLVLKGSINAGITVKTINKVYNNCIPVFECMLGKSKEDFKLPIICSTKFDGVRVLIMVNNGIVNIFTRTGKLLEIKSLIKEMKLQPDGWYDGELVSGDGLTSGRTRISGEVNKVIKGTSTEIKDYTYMVFDYVELGDWANKICKIRFKNRQDFLIDNLIETDNIKRVAQHYYHDRESIENLFANRIKNGFEGLILRYPEDYYEWKRSDRLIKMKSKITAELKCYAVEEGKGKYANMIGALHCKGIVDGFEIDTKVGTGLSDYDRDQSEDFYKGCGIEVEYNSIVSDKNTGKYSLFLPVFKRMIGDLDV